MTNAQPVSGLPSNMIHSTRRVSGLDSIRFVCAFVVMLGHMGLLKERLHGSTLTGMLKIAAGVFNSLFNAPAAVIVFFLISGFCIHYPYRGSRPFVTLPFYCRRFVRIAPPAIVFFIILRLVIHDGSSPQDTVLWSVVCEAIYYLLYPLLLFLRRQTSWNLLLTFATLGGIVVIATHADSLNKGSYGYTALSGLTWVVGLPCWLLGCWLAENFHRFPQMSSPAMWVMRSIIYVFSVVLELFRFHAHSVWASNCIILDIFAVPAALWLGCEISYRARNAPVKVLEGAGEWSYSLYLVHPLIIPLLAVSGFGLIDEHESMHLSLFVIALLASYAFFIVIERPAHRLAVAAGRVAEGASVHLR